MNHRTVEKKKKDGLGLNLEFVSYFFLSTGKPLRFSVSVIPFFKEEIGSGVLHG